MPQVCKICSSPQRAEVDAALIRGDGSNRRIASQLGVSEAAVRRHRASHLPQALVKSEAAQQLADSDSLVLEAKQVQGRAAALLTRAEEILEKAVQANDPRLALTAIKSAAPVLRELKGHIALRAELVGAFKEQHQQSAQILVLVPPPVPAGTITPLYPDQPEGDVIDVELLPPSPPPALAEPPGEMQGR